MDSYSYVNKILERIKNTSGLNAKKDLLKEGLSSKFSKDFELVLKHLYDPQIITGISKKKFYSSDGILTPDINYWTLQKLLDFLHKNTTGKKDDVEFLKSLYYLRPEKFLIYSIITKDINIGISRATVEKFIKIPKFEIMLGSHLEDDEIDWNRQYILTTKIDGVNLTCFKRQKSITFFTRQGKQVLGLNYLEDEYKKLKDGVYFGEAIYDTPKPLKREELFRLTTAEISQKKEFKKIAHYVFDYVTLEEWDNNQFVRPYNQSFHSLEKEIYAIQELGITPVIRPVPLVYMGHGKEEAMKYLDKSISMGDEGLMLRYCSSVYEKKRSKNLIKLKPYNEVDLKIIGFKEYKHPNMLGAFIVDFNGFPVNVGSGYSEEERKEFWNKRNEMIGHTIEIKYLNISKDRSGKESLRHPSFIRLRLDKD